MISNPYGGQGLIGGGILIVCERYELSGSQNNERTFNSRWIDLFEGDSAFAVLDIEWTSRI